MNVKRRTQAERSAATRVALVDAGRRLFAAQGFAGVGTEAIVREASVSRGALYHQFADKTELFAAVLEDVEADVSRHLVEVAGAAAPEGFAAAMLSAVDAWLQLCERPEVQRIVLVDGPSVLGWVRWREICQPHVLGLIQMVLEQGMAAGEVERQPIVPLSHALIAVADEAAMYVASAADPGAARAEMVAVAGVFVRALATRSAP
ncbi:TetR/AcrR family transcriptional regulator [Jiangella anatolica]|uniref:TetR family transcriptional regulator n=1 Tax=Jiangella anatolica TaxID=2670374 RepID=A0A2W2BHN3_9ACTN|nr:TetR/AcrR family transcriptional regulator [Jiangella anatolica]PZF79804.1 TetR family transcriptional regulator [Jiangella anatolica]